jgi:hypothetical protein
MLKNYKTYIVAVLLAVLTGAHALGYVTDEQYNIAAGFLGAGGLAALRSAIPKA